MKYQKSLILLSVIVLFGPVSCTSFQTRMGEPVQIVSDKTVVENCRFRGMVTGSKPLNRWYHAVLSIASPHEIVEYNRSLKDLRLKTALLEADTVLIVRRESMFEQAVITGRAYNCI